MRITLVIGSLENTGGSERSLSLLANSWAELGRAVTIIEFERSNRPAYPLHASINIQHLDFCGYSSNFVERVRRIVYRNQVLRKAIRQSQPDVVISFTPAANVRTIVATRGLRVPVIISERTDPYLYDIGYKWSTLRRLSYSLADMLVCQTTTCLNRFGKRSRTKGRVIPNLIAVSPAMRRAPKTSNNKRYVLIAMGRLVQQKGFDLLLRAFSQIMDRHCSWSLKILGEGSLRRQLEKLADDLNMTGRVQFAGVCQEPFEELSQADLFVLSSRFEGFPNALCEAMACGLPVISYDCPSGPRDIVRHGVDGILVPPKDVGALASALDDLMSDGAKRERLASRALEIAQRFPAERILSLWDETLECVMPAKICAQRPAQNPAFSRLECTPAKGMTRAER